MKRYLRSSRYSSFTLVEMLVVIGIIAILVGVLLSGANSAYKTAMRSKAYNTAVQIQGACMTYYTEYGVYPVPTNAATAVDTLIGDTSATDQTSWGTLIYALSGNIHPSTGLPTSAPAIPIPNSRSIAFLSLRSADVSSGDVPKNPLPPSSATNVYFNIAMDGDYDGVIGTGSSAVTTMPNFNASTFNAAAQAGGGSTTAGVAVWANCNSTTTTNAAFWVHTY